MTAVVVVVQHGERGHGAGDPGLTHPGRAQARAVAAALAPLEPAAIVSSPLRRARETAAPLAAATGLEVEEDARLAERVNREPGIGWDAFLDDWGRSTRDRAWRPPGGRTSLETAADLLAVLDARAVEGRVVVLASHAGATIDLLRSLLGDDALERERPGSIAGGVPSGALTTLERTPGGPWSVRSIGATAHLRPLDRC